MAKSYYEGNYWRLGFKTSLYDLLTPEAYRESARRCIQSVPIKKGQVLLDAGCGSGLLFEYLQEQIDFGLRYLGTDIIFPGLQRARNKKSQGNSGNALFCQSDLTRPLPIKNQSVDIVIAHFSLYTIADREIRQRVLSQLRETLKSRGLMVVVNPSREYDAKAIIGESLQRVQEEKGILSAWAKKLFLYPFTYYLGLKYIQQQLEAQNFKAFSMEELTVEIEGIGMSVVHSETLYAGSAHLLTARRVS